jgi:hypothetical protein
MASNNMITRDEAEKIATDAANSALHGFLIALDLDPSDRVHLKTLREDLAFIREQRLANAEAKKFVQNTARNLIPVALLAILTWSFFVFKDGLHDAFVQWIGNTK